MTVTIKDLIPQGDLTNKELSTLLHHVVDVDFHTVHRMASEIVRTRMLMLSLVALLDNETAATQDQALARIERMIRVEMASRERP